MRRHVTLTIDPTGPLPAPQAGRARQFVTRIPGVDAPVEALIVEPVEPTDRVLAYFLGFNIPLGPWELAKSSLLAAAFQAAVVVVEIPGQSRFGDRLPGPVRTQMLRGEVDAWASLQGDYLEAAMADAGLAPTGLDILGYSTGCTLAVASFERLSRLAPVSSVSLVEPVGALTRNLAELSVHNARDVLRQPSSYRTNHAHDWVMAARRRQLREPWVRYWPQDLLAITAVLRRDHLRPRLAALGQTRLNLVRGTQSDLCVPAAFDALDEAAGPGLTVLVEGFGHPLWHSFPVLVPLVDVLAGVNRSAAED